MKLLLDSVIVIDHFNGIPEIVSAHNVKNVLANAGFIKKAKKRWKNNCFLCILLRILYRI